jgi:hypothetical protein
MVADGNQNKSRALKNASRNLLSTLFGTLDISAPDCCLPQAEVAAMGACAASRQRSGGSKHIEIASFCQEQNCGRPLDMKGGIVYLVVIGSSFPEPKKRPGLI